MKSEIINQVEEALNESVLSSNSVGGGCIADSKLIQTDSGKRYFLKTYAGSTNMFPAEALGLKELAKPGCIRVPMVISCNNDFLLLENIDTGHKKGDFFAIFGQSFAHMHRYTSDNFGFSIDNFIGATPQYNIAHGNEKTKWAEFYFNKRLLPQLHFAEKKGYVSKELSSLFLKLEDKFESILADSEEPPTLLHGDLWGGNYMCDRQNNAVLIDPAVYYGHREADLAMTKMFGGFTTEFYRAYQSEYPLKDGWEYREGLYLLYHYLNHMNLFGMSYYGECLRLITKYV